MSVDELLVVLGGIGAIAWVNWYFLVAGRRVPLAAVRGEGTAEREEGGT